MDPSYIFKITCKSGTSSRSDIRQFMATNVKKLFIVASILFSTLTLAAQYSYTSLSGTFDDGSGAALYSNGYSGSYLIQPAGASTVTLSFTSFNTESGYDFVYVYNGADANAPLIGQYHNGNLPPATITSSGNSLFIRFTTDGSVNYDGWTAQYSGNLSGSGSTTSTLYPASDSGVLSSTRPGDEGFANTNYSYPTTMMAEVGTSSGYSYTWRCYIGLDLSSLPANAAITSAKLYLYSDGKQKNTTTMGSGYQSNACYIQRTTQAWSPTTITWNNVPSATSTNQVSLASSASISQDYVNDITQLVKDMRANPTQGNGMLMRLQSEVQYCTMSFYSSKYSVQAKRPKLELTYTSGGIRQTLTLTNNYIYSVTPQIALSDLTSTSTDNLLEDVDYFDGLGRPMQKVSIQVSPGGQDIVTPVSYDAFGREDKKYLPYALTAANNGAFVTNDKVESRWTNNYGTAEDGFAFAKTEFEPSPLNRVLKQGAPGATWQPNTVAASDRSVKFAYGSNIAADNVRMWTVNSDGSPASTSAYPVNSLYKTTIWDENNPNDLATTTSRTEEFKDLRGKVVLKRTYKGATTGSEALSTYYVYDDFELLRVVIPPLANGDGGNVAAVLSDLCYQYTYDTRKRMTVKKLPGADAVYMVYDQRDRLVAVQDGVQRAKSPDEWTFTKYDALNRTVMTGIYKVADATTPATVQATVNGISVYSEDRLITGYGYTNNSFPKLTGTTPVSITEADILTIIYYDTYGFPGAQAFDISVSNISGYDEGTTYEGTNRYYFEQLKGQVTGTKTKVLETTTFLTSTNYYDDHYRVIQGTRSLYDGFTGTETAYSKYDFVGKVIQTKQTQNFYSTALVKTTTTVDKYFTYDHAGRLKTTEQQITGDANGKVTVAANTYNEIGQLIDKKLHNNAQQSIDYQYNIRGWLTSINNPDNLANDGTGDTYADLFAERLLYNDNSTISNLTLKNQYNGNICGIILNRRSDATAATIKSAYGLTYDGLNRLNEATYAENTGSGYSINLNSYNEFGITYDKNGNILTLKRNSSGTLVDNLAYTYESANKSNRLQTVADNSNNITGFTDITNANDYTYDNNGNAAKDLNKGITGILYNVLNLPKTVTKDASNSITYTYTASGEKVMQATKVSGITTNRCYAGLFEYDNLKALSLVKMDEGIVTKTSSTYVYEYYLKDHLGNTRITFSPGASGPVLAQRTDYYPFGLACTNQYMGSTGNGYLYNGKELQKALGWQVYDYGARFYDPTIGRWHVTDPMGEKHYNYTPYAYVYNNPITLIDPLGLDSVYFSTQGKVVDRKVNKSQDKFFTRTYEEKKVSTEDGSTVTTGTETKDTEISMDSDIGTIARTTYAEMRGGDDNAKSIVAESIVNRSNLPDGSYEKADGTITGIVNKSYDVTKNTNKANPVFKNPENYFNNNSTENSAWLSSLGSAVKAYYGNSNVGKGVIFYNSSSSTIYDKNPNMQKINLSITVLGIKGLWKLK